MGRTAFLVDEFNLYHSLKEAQRSFDAGGLATRRCSRLRPTASRIRRAKWTGVSTS